MICALVIGTLQWHVALCQELYGVREPARDEEEVFILENLFSVPEAARRLGGISKWTLHAWLSQGKLKRTKVGRRTMIRESELERLIRDGTESRLNIRTSKNVRTVRRIAKRVNI